MSVQSVPAATGTGARWPSTAAVIASAKASRVGVFAEDMRDGEQGELVAVADAQALANAMTAAVERQRAPVRVVAGTDWADIGQATSKLYRDLRGRRPVAVRASAPVKVLP